MPMASTYKDADVQCPFYKEQTGRTISCEGVTDDSIIKQYYWSPKSKDIQMDVFCKKNYKNCEVYRMLEKKYEE